MMRLRPFKLGDAEYLLKWMGDECTFAQWCANKFTYPLTKEQIVTYYENYEKDANAWIMTALDEEGVPVGHFLMRSADYNYGSIHLGFIIVDTMLRGKGYGKEMVSLATKYAFEILNVKRVTLGVFDSNLSAYYCYQSVGFSEIKYNKACFLFENDKWGVYDMVIEKDSAKFIKGEL